MILNTPSWIDVGYHLGGDVVAQRDPRGTVGSTLEGLMLTESSRRAPGPARRGGVVLPRLVGQDLEVQLAGGETRTYVNLDMAASTPAMEAVADAVIEFLPWYSSVHRGAGFASQVSTRAYEAARVRGGDVRRRAVDPMQSSLSETRRRRSTS